MQLVTLAICMLAMMIDGYDVYVMGFLIPPFAKFFHVTPADVTPVMFYQNLGLAIGSMLVSPTADRFGRKTVLMACAGAFGLVTLAATRVTSITQLELLRFLAGIFLSGVIPNAIALTSEVAPPRARATLVTIMFCGFTFGTAFGGYAATLLLKSYGWQGALWGGGLAPLLFLPVFWLFMPESLQFRVSRNGRDPRVAKRVRELDPTVALTGNEHFVLHEAVVSGAPVAALFHDGRTFTTLLLWFAFFMSLMGIQLDSALAPTFFTTYSSMTLQNAAGIGIVMAGAGIVTMLFYGAVLDRVGPTRVLTLTCVVGGIAVAAIGQLPWFSALFYLAIVLEGACVIGTQSGLNALSAVIYPTRMRATGIGWAFGMGRVGAMVAPLIAGSLLRNHFTVQAVFIACAAPTLLVAVGTFLVGFGARREDDAAAFTSPAEGRP